MYINYEAPGLVLICMIQKGYLSVKLAYVVLTNFQFDSHKMVFRKRLALTENTENISGVFIVF